MPRRFGQLYLGPSSERTLCLMQQPPKPPVKSLGKCYISMLPNELLANIFAYVPPKMDSYRPPNYKDCPPIAIICKHWECVYDATLYRTIWFFDCQIQQRRRTSKLVESLRQQPSLCRHVRNIFVERFHPSEAQCRIIADTISSCQAIRTVSLHLDWSAKIWPIIVAVGMLPRLERLWLSGYDKGPSLQTILRYFKQPTLRSIQLSRHGLSRGDTPGAPWIPIERPSKDEMDDFSVAVNSHASAITSLQLDDPSISPQCTMIFLKWPERLVRLSLSQLQNSVYGSHYTLDAVENILNIHRESLQYIMVGLIPRRRIVRNIWTESGIPNFSNFQCLQRLQISAFNTFAETPSNAATKLAAPALHHLTISCCTEDQNTASWRYFGKDEALWIADFASQKSAVDSNTILQKMFIDFNPEGDPRELYYGEDTTWPNEYLQPIEDQTSLDNMILKYSDPGFKKVEW